MRTRYPYVFIDGGGSAKLASKRAARRTSSMITEIRMKCGPIRILVPFSTNGYKDGWFTCGFSGEEKAISQLSESSKRTARSRRKRAPAP